MWPFTRRQPQIRFRRIGPNMRGNAGNPGGYGAIVAGNRFSRDGWTGTQSA